MPSDGGLLPLATSLQFISYSRNMRSSFIYRWSRRTGWVVIDLSRRFTSYLEKLSKLSTSKLHLLNFDMPIAPIPGTRRAIHKNRSKRPSLHSTESCLSEPAAIAISIGYENRYHSSSILAHSINMALCKDSFTGHMRSFDFDEVPPSWEDFLTRTSHVWSPEFSGYLRKKGRSMGRTERGRDWFGERSYKGWIELIVGNLLEFFEAKPDVEEGLGAFDPMAKPRVAIA